MLAADLKAVIHVLLASTIEPRRDAITPIS
jgi:hypothetical protein